MEPGRRLEAKDWPDISLEKWGKWGFDVSEVLRTPRHNFMVQPVRTTIFEVEGKEAGFVLEGIWYRINGDKEKQLEKLILPASMFMMLLVVGMLWAVWINWGIVAVMAFLLLYITAEGLIPMSLNLSASKTKSNRVEIPWSAISRVVHLPKPGVLLIGFDEGAAMAVQFLPETSEIVFSRLKAGITKGTEVEVLNHRSIYHPPSG